MKTYRLKDPKRVPVAEIQSGALIYRQTHGGKYYRAEVQSVERITSTNPALNGETLIKIGFIPEGSNVLAFASFPLFYQMPIPAR
jgi:hypothetical protein